MTNWYQLPRKTTLCLILIIMRSSKVIKITAGKLIHLSVGTFGDVSNTYIYLSIIICLFKDLITLIVNYTELKNNNIILLNRNQRYFR